MSRYIDAEILLDAMRHITLGETDVARSEMKIVHYICHMPHIDDVRENVRGEWIDCGVHGDWAWETDGHGNCWHIWKCSQCGYKTEQCSNYCPNCGADMRGEV